MKNSEDRTSTSHFGICNLHGLSISDPSLPSPSIGLSPGCVEVCMLCKILLLLLLLQRHHCTIVGRYVQKIALCPCQCWYRTEQGGMCGHVEQCRGVCVKCAAGGALVGEADRFSRELAQLQHSTRRCVPFIPLSCVVVVVVVVWYDIFGCCVLGIRKNNP